MAKKRQIIPFIPLVDKSERNDGTWSRSDFEWGEDNDCYICPDGKYLNRTRQNHPDPRNKKPRTGRRKYRASKYECDICRSKPNGCPKTNARTITREEREDARDFARLALKSDFNTKAQATRKTVEMLFARLKRILKLGRLRLRGPCSAQEEFTLAAIAQNLRKLAKLRPQTAKMRIAI